MHNKHDPVAMSMGFEKVKAQLQAILRLEREMRERLKLLVPNIENIRHRLHERKLGPQATMKLADSCFEFDNCPSPNEAAQHADEVVEYFIKKLDAKEKKNLDFSDFKGLKEEIEVSERYSLPPSLVPFDARIKGIFGDFAADCPYSSCITMPARIMFCSAIKEMDSLRLEQIDDRKILLWRDAINCALCFNFKVEFAIEHLKKIASAYFGLKALSEQVNNPELMSKTERISSGLVIEQRTLEAMHAQKAVEERNSEMRKQCVRDAEYFDGKSLSAGLFY